MGEEEDEDEEGAAEGEAPADGDAKAEGEGADQEKEPEVDKTSLIYVMLNISFFQKINFTSIGLTFFGQGLKYLYDSMATQVVTKILEQDRLALIQGSELDYPNTMALFSFNNMCMGLDSSIICMASISLLKYTQLFNPDIEKIVITIKLFMFGTFKKTMVMILLAYLLFGLISHYFYSYYQYGFFDIPYALLRSCIVFLSGFIINE